MTNAPPEHPRPQRLIVDKLPSPIGHALLFTDEAGYLRALHWEDFEERFTATVRRMHPGVPLEPGAAPDQVRRPIADYFGGALARLADTPWRIGGTAFQRTVWTALHDIPPGEIRTYAAQAARIGNPTAIRAVGAANGANPISLVLPCHRVLGSNGTLTGYGGGLHRKQWLLAHEGARA
ncbi:MAG: cysteine methyltransferase [Caulobacter sp.]|nr:cysteine methyltransferase [Caulobacter sp.]